MEILQAINIFAEAIIVLLGIAMTLGKKRIYGGFIALSYALYLVYDLSYFIKLAIDQTVLQVLLVIGVVLTLIAVWLIYKEK